MYKLLIVEDEKKSREGLKNLLSENIPKIEIETAVNGVEGYEKAIYFQPDIIISDIQMPKNNGLEMIRKLRKQKYEGIIYLLTGFAEFEYAQKALQYSVSDYILKPIIPAQIISKIKDSIVEIEKIKHINYSANTEKLILLSEDDEILLHKQLSKKNYTDCFYAIIYMEDQKHLPEAVQDELSQISNLHMIVLPDKHYSGIVVGFENNTVHHSTIAKLVLIIQKYDYLTCIYNIKKFAQIQNLFQEFELLQESIYWSITYNSRFFIFENRMTEKNQEYIEDSFYNRELKRLYFSEEYEKCQKFILKRLKSMQTNMVHPKHILITVTFSIMKTSSEQQYLETLNKISSAKTEHELVTMITDYFLSLQKEIKNANFSKLVQSAVNEIYELYHSQISLNFIADKLAITPQYLSKIFMKETGKTFIDFLTLYRIEKAKELLNETNTKINVICTKVGYPDAKYFCTLFKKYVGISPEQYRKHVRIKS